MYNLYSSLIGIPVAGAPPLVIAVSAVRFTAKVYPYLFANNNTLKCVYGIHINHKREESWS